jgi:hypothetical protein
MKRTNILITRLSRKWEAQFDEYFRLHPVLKLRHEDLAADYGLEMMRVQDFWEWA